MTFQFALSQVFIIGTLIALWQMSYIRNVDLGYDRDWIVYVNLPERSDEKRSIWKADLEANTDVIQYAFGATPPFSGSTSSTNANFNVDGEEQQITTYLKVADSRYIETYGLELLAGEGLLESDQINRYVINETFAKKMGNIITFFIT